MGGSIRNCGYCFFGGLADLLGMSAEERCVVIPSLYEEFILNRTDQDDLMHRHAYKLAYIHFTPKKTPDERRDYVLSDSVRDKMSNAKTTDNLPFYAISHIVLHKKV